MLSHKAIDFEKIYQISLKLRLLFRFLANASFCILDALAMALWYYGKLCMKNHICNPCSGWVGMLWRCSVNAKVDSTLDLALVDGESQYKGSALVDRANKCREEEKVLSSLQTLYSLNILQKSL